MSEERKKKKEKEQTSTSEKEKCAVDLPELALDLIVNRLVSVRDLFSFNSVCRSWRSCPLPSGIPPLLFVPIPSPLLKILTHDISFPRDLPSQTSNCLRCLGYSSGRLLFLSHPRRILILHVLSGHVTPIPLPSPPPILTRISLVTDTGAILFASDSAIHCYQPLFSSSSWSCLDNHGATSLTLFNNRIFALDSSGALHSIYFTPRGSIRSRRFEARLPEPSPVVLCLYFRYRLVQCAHDLLLIRVSIQHVRRCIDVFRLDLEGSVWTEVSSLGDWCLFLDVTGSCAVACPAVARWGGRANCVFVAVPGMGCENWVVVPLDGDRLFQLPDEKIGCSNNMLFRWPVPIWVYPKMLQYT